MKWLAVISILILLGACDYSDRPMYGEVLDVNAEEQTVTLDVTDWSKEVGLEDPVNDILLTEQIQLTDEMIIEFEHDQPAGMEDLFIGQQVTVQHGEEGEEVTELLLMERQREIAEVIAAETTIPSDFREVTPDVQLLLKQAGTPEQYEELWRYFGLQAEAPEVEFDDKTVIFFSLLGSGSCPPELRSEGIQANSTAGTLELEVFLAGNPEAGCTADASPRTIVITVNKDAGPFTEAVVDLGQEGITVPIK